MTETNAGQGSAESLNDAAAGLEELAGLISFRVGAWQDFGYGQPPAPGCAVIPPLGKRSASAIRAGHRAVKDIDQLIARLHQVRAQLVSELRRNQDILMGGQAAAQTTEDQGLRRHSYDPDSHKPGNSCTYCGRGQDDPLHGPPGSPMRDGYSAAQTTEDSHG